MRTAIWLENRTRFWVWVMLVVIFEITEWIQRHYPVDTYLPADAHEAAAWLAVFGLWGCILMCIPRDERAGKDEVSDAP